MKYGIKQLLLALVVMVHCHCFARAVVPGHRFFKTSDGVSLHYVDAGEGAPALVMVPGWLMPADVFQRQVASLSQNHRVIVLDPRGQGKSQVTSRLSAESRARDIGELLEHTGVKEYVLLGWSLGVMESLDFLARGSCPGLRGLVLVDNSIGMGTPPIYRPNVQARRPTTTKAFQVYIESFAASMFRTPPGDELIDTIVKSAQKLPPASAWSLLDKPYPRDYYRRAVLAAEVPVWYAITPKFAEQGKDLTNALPSATVTVFEGAGHALFVDQSDRFNNELQQFLKRLP